MIRRITKEGPSGGKLNFVAEDKFDIEGALMALHNAFEAGYKTLEYRDTKIVLEQHSNNFKHATYQTFTGPAKSMKKLVMVAKANKIAESIS